jgi:predicted RNase H-like nuclease (RuvC/YqgF family)
MKVIQMMASHHRVPEAEETLNNNFTVIAETLEERRQCIATLLSLVEQQQKEIDSLRKESQTHHSLMDDLQAHNKDGLNDLQAQINDLTRNLLEVTRAMTTFVQTTDARLNPLELTQVSQFYKNKSDEWK